MRNQLVKLRGSETQVKVASDLKISQQYLSLIESGTRSPGLKLAIKIARYYNTSIDKVFPDIFL